MKKIALFNLLAMCPFCPTAEIRSGGRSCQRYSARVCAEFWRSASRRTLRTTQSTANLMLRTLLADRFGLVIRNETRPIPRYVLSLGKDGLKLKSSKTLS